MHMKIINKKFVVYTVWTLILLFVVFFHEYFMNKLGEVWGIIAVFGIAVPIVVILEYLLWDDDER